MSNHRKPRPCRPRPGHGLRDQSLPARLAVLLLRPEAVARPRGHSLSLRTTNRRLAGVLASGNGAKRHSASNPSFAWIRAVSMSLLPFAGGAARAVGNGCGLRLG